jgi:hypothetical protein|eukprot:COSAG02_NODE_2223_length_9455_cov_5.513675_6_plen_59_part_00
MPPAVSVAALRAHGHNRQPRVQVVVRAQLARDLLCAADQNTVEQRSETGDGSLHGGAG